MLRFATLFWMAIAVAVGLLLYNVKHKVQGLEQQLARTNRAIHETRERIYVLHAEWSLLNQPERLRALAARHLDLVPMRPSQFAQPQAIAALPIAPPHGALAAAQASAEPAAAEPATAGRAAPTERAPAERAPAERAPQAATAAREAEKPARALRREEPPPPRQAAPEPRRELEARAAPRPLMPEPRPSSPRHQDRSPVVTVSAAPLPLPAAAPAPTPASGQPPARGMSASSLGTPAVALPPPVPIARPAGRN